MKSQTCKTRTLKKRRVGSTNEPWSTDNKRRNEWKEMRKYMTFRRERRSAMVDSKQALAWAHWSSPSTGTLPPGRRSLPSPPPPELPRNIILPASSSPSSHRSPSIVPLACKRKKTCQWSLALSIYIYTHDTCRAVIPPGNIMKCSRKWLSMISLLCYHWSRQIFLPNSMDTRRMQI